MHAVSSFILLAIAMVHGDVINPPRNLVFDESDAASNGFFYEITDGSGALESLVWEPSRDHHHCDCSDGHWYDSSCHESPECSDWAFSSDCGCSEEPWCSSEHCECSESWCSSEECHSTSDCSTETHTTTHHTPETTSTPTTTPEPTVLPESGTVEPEKNVASTTTVYANACTTFIVCNPARTDCPNNMSQIYSAVANAIASPSGATAIVNGTTVAVNSGGKRTVVVSGSTVVTLGSQAKNDAQTNLVGPLGTIGAFIVAAVFLLA